jgi:hypothetical protein
MIAHRKYNRKPVLVLDEIELLLQFPFGGLIGGEILPQDLTGMTGSKVSTKAKHRRRTGNLRYYRKEEELLRTRNLEK